MWEASIWVLLLAVFVYGMRTSLYAMRGLAVGIMWESWCVGQMTARVVMLSEGLGVVALVCVVAAALYVVSVVLQLTAGVAPGCEAISVAVSDRGAEKGAVQTEIGQASAKRSPYANPVPSTGDAGPGAGSMRPAEGGAASVAEAPDPYPALARRFGLSERELEVLRLLGRGAPRSTSPRRSSCRSTPPALTFGTSTTSWTCIRGRSLSTSSKGSTGGGDRADICDASGAFVAPCYRPTHPPRTPKVPAPPREEPAPSVFGSLLSLARLTCAFALARPYSFSASSAASRPERAAQPCWLPAQTPTS